MLFTCAFPSVLLTWAQEFSQCDSGGATFIFLWHFLNQLLFPQGRQRKHLEISQRNLILRVTTRWHSPGRTICAWGMCLQLWHHGPTRKGLPNPNLLAQSPVWAPLEGCPGSLRQSALPSCPLPSLYQGMGQTGLNGRKEGSHLGGPTIHPRKWQARWYPTTRTYILKSPKFFKAFC